MVDRSGLRDELRRMLEDLEKEPAVDIFTIAPVDERAASESRLRDLWGQKVEVDRIEDLTFPSAGHSINVRLYCPAGATGTILFIHGGGWVVGSIETHDGPARALAHAAAANVVSIEYRKAPEHPFPAAVVDVDAGLDWLLSNGEAMGLDTGRLVVVGESAGGTLAAVLARHARDRGIELAGAALVYPPTDASMSSGSYRDYAEGYYLSARAMAWFYHHYLDGGAVGHPDASPVRARDLAKLPPTLVITAEFDPLRDEGRAYAARLIESGNNVTYVEVPGAIHGIWVMNDKTQATREIIGIVAGWSQALLTLEPAHPREEGQPTSAPTKAQRVSPQ
jgi:acetyl esterase